MFMYKPYTISCSLCKYTSHAMYMYNKLWASASINNIIHVYLAGKYHVHKLKHMVYRQEVHKLYLYTFDMRVTKQDC